MVELLNYYRQNSDMGKNYRAGAIAPPNTGEVFPATPIERRERSRLARIRRVTVGQKL